jgi:hypothetical protein
MQGGAEQDTALYGEDEKINTSLTELDEPDMMEASTTQPTPQGFQEKIAP